MDLTRALAEDESALRRLWSQLYGDSDAYIDLFFRHRFSPETTAVLRDGENIAGVMYLLPCRLGDGRECDYAYAGGIAPPYRGKGHFRALVNALICDARARGRLLCCVPGEGLWDFYRSLGLRTEYRRREITVSPCDGTGIALAPMSPSRHTALRKAFSGSDAVFWEENAVRYAQEEAIFDRGFAVTVSTGDREYFALGGLRGETLLVEETTLPPLLLSAAAGALTAAHGGKSVLYHLPDTASAGTAVPSGLLLGEEKPADGWLGLTLVL